MKIVHLLAAGAASLAVAAPALAQQPYPYQPQPQVYPQYQQVPQYQQQYQYPQQAYPQQQYPYAQHAQPGYGYPGQAYGQQGGIGQIINQMLGNRYNTAPDRTAVTQCATAAQAQASAQYRPNAYGQQQPYPGYNGYAQASQARVTGITNVERIRNGTRVSGTMTSGMMAPGNRYGYGNQAYNPGYANAASNLTFRCNVDYRGMVSNVRIRPMTYRR